MEILNKLRHIFPSSALLIYFTLVHPHLLYSLPIWGSTFPTYLQKLQRLQNKTLRIISNCNPKTSTTPLFYQYKILKIQDLYYFEIAKIMHQYSNNTFQSALYHSLPKPVQFIIGLLDLIFETIYTYHTSYRLDVNDQLNIKGQKSGTPSLLIFETNCLIPSNVILQFSSYFPIYESKRYN